MAATAIFSLYVDTPLRAYHIIAGNRLRHRYYDAFSIIELLSCADDAAVLPRHLFICACFDYAAALFITICHDTTIAATLTMPALFSLSAAMPPLSCHFLRLLVSAAATRRHHCHVTPVCSHRLILPIRLETFHIYRCQRFSSLIDTHMLY